jgi:hypothetical protein
MRCHHGPKGFHHTKTTAPASPREVAERRAQAKLGFMIHLAVFGMISNIQFVQGLINWDFSFVRGLLGWGLGVAIHGIALLFSQLNIEERLVQQELEQFQKR